MQRDQLPARMSIGPGVAEGGGGATTRQLAHLESILRELTRHEARSTTESVERTSAVTQQRLLKDQLIEAQEELAVVQASKAGLCEEVGALRQASAQFRKEIEAHKAEIAAAREAQDALLKKVAELEGESRSLKRHYIRSLDCRMKTAAKLLWKIQLNAPSPLKDAADVARELSTKTGEWADSDMNKRKRQLDDEEEQRESDVSMSVDAVATDKDVASISPQSTATRTVSDVGRPECQECANMKATHQTETTELISKLSAVEAERSTIQGKQDQLADELSRLKSSYEAEASELQKKRAEIDNLKQKLAELSEKDYEAAVPENSSAPHQSVSDLETQVKLLEDNLSQMNSYADQLELVISQCPSCTIKLQSESTQDSSTVKSS